MQFFFHSYIGSPFCGSGSCLIEPCLPSYKRETCSFVNYRLDFGCDFRRQLRSGWFWPFCGIWKFLSSVQRGRNSSAPLSRLPCHLNAAYPHPLSKCQSQSATDCALVHCKLPTCSYMVHTILPPKVPKSPELLTIAGHFNLPWLKNKRVATFTSSVGIAINICSDFNVGDCVCLKVQNFS